MAASMCLTCMRRRDKLLLILDSVKVTNLRYFGIHKGNFANKKTVSRHQLSTLDIKVSDRLLRISQGKLAKLTSGAAEAQYGDTSVLVTVVCKKSQQSSDMVPLTVNYRQKASAVGRVPTNFRKRDMVSDGEILISRLIDRSIRPLFPKTFTDELQLICNVLAYDKENDPDIVCINAVSAALHTSSIPWDGPIGAVRVGLMENEFFINPTKQQQQRSKLDLTVVATRKSIVMLEASADIVNPGQFLNAVRFGFKAARHIAKEIFMNTVKANQRETSVKKEVPDGSNSLEKQKSIREYMLSNVRVPLKEILTDSTLDKQSRDRAIQSLQNSLIEKKFPENCEDRAYSQNVFQKLLWLQFRQLILDENRRCDGRGLTDVRNISCEVDLYKPLHGSALFTRGQTQVLCTVTYDSLATLGPTDRIHLISGLKQKTFFVQYEFPSYAINEISSPTPSAGRRELGHGALAERGLLPVIPKDYPFSIRLTSEVLESNGSSSMATVCGGSLALMDAGVPITQPAAGVAIGLVTSVKGLHNYCLLTDILGIEDYMGDMDFKIAGTSTGVTALQMDLKLPGIPMSIVEEAVQRGVDGYCRVLDTMAKTKSAPNPERKANGPVIKIFEILQEKRGKLFGIGSSNMRKIQRETGAIFTEIDNKSFEVFAHSPDVMDEVIQLMGDVTEEEREPEFTYGATYVCRILELKETGVMVEINPKVRPVYVPNSQMDMRKVKHSDALGLEIEQEVHIQYLGRDPVSGQHRLSRKALQLPVSHIKNSLKARTPPLPSLPGLNTNNGGQNNHV